MKQYQSQAGNIHLQQNNWVNHWLLKCFERVTQEQHENGSRGFFGSLEIGLHRMPSYVEV